MKKVVQWAVVLVVLLWTSLLVRAVPVSNTGPGLVTSVLSYTEFGNGDVAFTTQNMPSQCDGYWLRPANLGFKTTLALVMSAYLADKQVIVYADDAFLWPGSGNRYCLVAAVKLTP